MVHVDRAAIGRWLREYEEHLDLLLRERAPATGDLAEAMDLASAAAQVANGAIEDESVRARGVDTSPWGPVVRVDHPAADVPRERWLAALVAHLSGAGWSGTIEPVMSDGLTGDQEDLLLAPALGVFLSLRRDDVGYRPSPVAGPDGWRPPRWGVSPADTVSAARRLGAWCVLPGGDTFVSQTVVGFRAEPAEVPERLAWSCLRDQRCSAKSVIGDRGSLRHVHFSSDGEVVASAMIDDAGWGEAVDGAREALVAVSEVLELGFVRRRAPGPGTWRDLHAGRGGVDLPHVSATKAALRRSVRDAFIPDVHGMQVLAPAHLHKVRSLDGWSVDEVAPERFLVQAHDLAAWYANPAPDPDVLAAARESFADVLLTPEAIAAYRADAS